MTAEDPRAAVMTVSGPLTMNRTVLSMSLSVAVIVCACVLLCLYLRDKALSVWWNVALLVINLRTNLQDDCVAVGGASCSPIAASCDYNNQIPSGSSRQPTPNCAMGLVA